MKYRLYYEYSDEVRKHLPPTIEIHYEFGVYDLRLYTIIDEDLLTFLTILDPEIKYITRPHAHQPLNENI